MVKLIRSPVLAGADVPAVLLIVRTGAGVAALAKVENAMAAIADRTNTRKIFFMSFYLWEYQSRTEGVHYQR
jgi:hypothetical protein